MNYKDRERRSEDDCVGSRGRKKIEKEEGREEGGGEGSGEFISLMFLSDLYFLSLLCYVQSGSKVSVHLWRHLATTPRVNTPYSDKQIL